MTPRARFLFAGVFGAGAALFVELAARWIARRDLLAGMLSAIDPPLLALGGLALITRLFVLFVVPGWVAYAAARWLLANVRSRAPNRA
jgi:hypothetical protein